MQITIARGRASEMLHDGVFYRTGVPIDVDLSTAVRLSRMTHIDANWESFPYDPALFKEGFLNFAGDVDMTSGFGGVSYHLLTDTPYTTALAGRTLGVRDSRIQGMQKRALNPNGAMVWHDQPREGWLYSPFGKNIAIVPFETTRIPASWIGKINLFDALLVPCKQNIQAFRDSGVSIPIDLIHWGVDPAQFSPIERPDRDVFTFGSMGKLTVRKGTDLLVPAFLEAFPRQKDVRLVCKTSDNVFPFAVSDKRVSVQMGEVSHEELMNDFFRTIDCFVFPTRGEGFGLTPLEAMATGVPAIVTGWSGPMEYMTPETGWLLDFKFAPAQIFTEHVYKEDCGEWAEPSKEHLIALMRYAYEHRDEVKAKGRAAAALVQREWLWRQKIGLYTTALEKYL